MLHSWVQTWFLFPLLTEIPGHSSQWQQYQSFHFSWGHRSEQNHQKSWGPSIGACKPFRKPGPSKFTEVPRGTGQVCSLFHSSGKHHPNLFNDLWRKNSVATFIWSGGLYFQSGSLSIKFKIRVYIIIIRSQYFWLYQMNISYWK